MQLKLTNVTKSYTKGRKRRNALDNFTLEMTEGVYGLLGPNGAGKSTLINIIAGIIPRDSGSIFYDCDGDHDYLSHLGFMPQGIDFYRNFTARDYIKYIMVLKKFKAENADEYALETLAKVNLADEADKKIGAFSGGMKDIAFIAKTVVLMDKGRIIKSEPQEKLCRDISGKVWELEADPTEVTDLMSRMRVPNAKYSLQREF